MRFKGSTIPAWAFLSLAASGLLTGAVILLLLGYCLAPNICGNRLTQIHLFSNTLAPKPVFKLRQHMDYEDWVARVGQEAKVTAAAKPEHLTVLAGDSLTMWFPPELLPPERHWLNQGISGETAAGLLKRLTLFDKTQPEIIFVMIGINDLLRGETDENILAYQQQIIRYLRRVHPQSQIIFQSILPHRAVSLREGGANLLAIPNQRIRELNRRLAALAATEGIGYLDLYPLFSDEKGDLAPYLTTDGLHLNHLGYLVWRSALQVLDQTLYLKKTGS